MAKQDQTVKNGRVPLSTKKTKARQVHPDSPSLEPDITALSEELLEELGKKNFVHRWINQAEYVKNGGFHRSGWRAYRSEKRDSSGDLGTNADGYITRMGLILAVKTTEQQAQHRARIQRRNQDMDMAVKSKTEEFKKVARQAGATVDEGYEEDSNDFKSVQYSSNNGDD